MDDGYMRVCAWCLEYGRDPYMGGPRVAPPHMVTHGICSKCEREILDDWYLQHEDYLPLVEEKKEIDGAT